MDLAKDSEHEFEAFVDEWLRFDRDEQGMLKPDLQGKQTFVRIGEMMERMNAAGFKTSYERSLLRNYLARKHGIQVTNFWNKREQRSMRGFEHVNMLKNNTIPYL